MLLRTFSLTPTTLCTLLKVLLHRTAEFLVRWVIVKELQADFTPDTIEKLKANRCDVAFVNLPIEVNEGLRLEENCARLNDIFIAGERFDELSTEVLALEKMKKYPLILMDKNTVSRRSFEGFLSSLGIEFKSTIEVGSWDLMKRFVARGMGIGVIPKEYAAKELAMGELFEVRTDPVLPVRAIGMLLPKGQPVSFALQSFIEYFRK